jgi:L-fuculose-phosphate aldolase
MREDIMKPPRPLIHPRDELVQTMERIYRHRMTTTSGGNLSLRDEDGDVWITPARVDKGNLRPVDVVRIRADGRVEGLHRPSSEYPFHQAIYRRRPDLRAVVHAHPVALVAFSICRKVPDTSLFPQAHHVCAVVGYATYALPGSEQLGERIADVFARGFGCVLLENHGVVVGGQDLAEAFQRFETLEFTARTIIRAGVLGGVRYLTPEQLALAQAPRPQMPEFEPCPATTQEKALRRDVCEFVRRGYRQRLMTSTQGSFSARLDGDSFLITSYRTDRQNVEVGRLTLVRDGRREAGKQPSRAARIHQAIYRRHGEVRAVVNAIPVNATAFAVTAVPLDTRTIPESYLFLRDVTVIPFGLQYEDGERIAALVSPQKPIALLENDGVLVLGTSVLDAFDRLEVLESTAEALIDSRAIGAVARMSDGTIDELVRAFLPNSAR